MSESREVYEYIYMCVYIYMCLSMKIHASSHVTQPSSFPPPNPFQNIYKINTGATIGEPLDLGVPKGKRAYLSYINNIK